MGDDIVWSLWKHKAALNCAGKDSRPFPNKTIADKSKSTPDSGYLERSLAMGLCIIEIMEDDCGGNHALETTIINKSHIETLIGKWYKDDLSDDEWKFVAEMGDLKINQKIFLRSPITCQTKDLKICKKCWGEKNLKTKYLGILAGQILAERFTQLSLRSFHDSGSAVLETNDTLLTFIKDHLIDIKTEDFKIVLVFDTDTIPVEFTGIPNYSFTTEKAVVFKSHKSIKQNTDPVEGLRKVREVLQSKNKPTKTPSEYYQLLMELVLEVGSPYSSFVECLLTNMFLVKKDGDLWRYNQTQKIVKKLGDRTLASQISPLLNLLYQQNQKTVENIEVLDYYANNEDKLTIYEKLFLERF